MKPNQIGTLLQTTRPPFLILTPACVFLGIATALKSGATISPVAIALVLLGALAAHISVNTFNEYLDFRSGLDAKTDRTPFSGGSGGLVAMPEAANAVLYLAIATLAITLLVGFYFVFRLGVAIIPIGFVGTLVILTYTPWLNRNPWLCLVAPGLGFGPLMVVGTHLALTGEYSGYALLVSLVPFFLVNNLLLLNQFPDVDADREVGRYHFPIAYGLKKSVMVYGAFTVSATLIVIVAALVGYLPRTSYIALISMAAAIAAWRGASRYANDTGKLMPYLAMNVLAAVVTPVLLGIGMILG